MKDEGFRLDGWRLSSTVVPPKNFVPPVFVKTKESREVDVVRWLVVGADRGDRNMRFVVKTMRAHGMSANDLIVEGLIRLSPMKEDDQ
jgi:hypothetical protein